MTSTASAGKASLSVVIVNWNGAERLGRCLSALREDLNSTPQGKVEVVIVDNGSRDDSLTVAKRILPDASTVEMSRNQGFAEGANRGISVATGEWVATLNNDVRVEIGWTAAMRRAATDCEPACGMLQPCMLRADRSTQIDTTGVVVRKGGQIEDRHRGEVRREASAAGEIFCPSGGAAWYRRRMLDAVAPDGGFFNPGFFMYFEDVDLGWRCRLAGWSAQYVPDAVVLHELHGSAGAQAIGFVKRQCARNRIRTVLGNGSARFVAGAMPRLARDMGWLLADSGHHAIAAIRDSIRAGLLARDALPPESCRARQHIESMWFSPR